jgi:hypothetical protein
MNLSAKTAWSVAGWMAACAVWAQAPEQKEAFYRCKDASGQPRFGSAMPAECQGRDTEVVSQRGTVLRVIEGEASRNRRAEQEAVEAREMQLRNDQAQRDRVLLETYLAVEDIERLRDQRLDLLGAQLKVSEQHVGTLRDRLQKLREQAAKFRPYADRPNAQPLPEQIAQELVTTLKNLAVDMRTMEIKREEQATLTTNFARDIKRFKEIKGIK